MFSLGELASRIEKGEEVGEIRDANGLAVGNFDLLPEEIDCCCVSY